METADVAISRQTMSGPINWQPSMTIAQRVNRIDCRSFRAGKGGRGKKEDGETMLWWRIESDWKASCNFQPLLYLLWGNKQKRTVCFLVAGTKIAAHRASPPVRIVFPRNKIQGFLSKRDRSITSVPPLPTSLSHRSFKPSRDYAINPTKKRNINRKNEKERKTKKEKELDWNEWPQMAESEQTSWMDSCVHLAYLVLNDTWRCEWKSERNRTLPSDCVRSCDFILIWGSDDKEKNMGKTLLVRLISVMTLLTCTSKILGQLFFMFMTRETLGKKKITKNVSFRARQDRVGAAVPSGFGRAFLESSWSPCRNRSIRRQCERQRLA